MFYLVFFRILCLQAMLTKGFPGESESHSVMSDSVWPHGLSSPRNSPGQNTGVESCAFLQEIFPNQRSNPGLPHCRKILYQLSHQGSPTQTWVKPPDCSWEIYCSFAEIGKFSRDENLRNREKYICCVLIEVSDETWKVVLSRCVISIGYYHRAIF